MEEGGQTLKASMERMLDKGIIYPSQGILSTKDKKFYKRMIFFASHF